MQFFDIYPENFFAVFSSLNKRIYIEALFVIRHAYQHTPVISKEDLVSSLIANLENQILALEEEDGVLSLEDNLSGRAHFLIRKFLETGWLEREQDSQSFTEQFVVPVYASKLLNLFHDLVSGKTTEYNGFVYSAYSILKTADLEREEYMYDGLRQAHQLTENLENALRELLANLRFYHHRLQEQVEVSEILAEHFDVFRQKISDRIYHPLKTFDSVPRFKNRILKILKNWLTEAKLIDDMAKTANKRGYDLDIDVCRQKVIVMIGEIIDTYEGIDQLLKSIDKKNTRYTRASVERMQYFINTDRDLKGKLVEILKKLPDIKDTEGDGKISELNMGLPLFQQVYIDEDSMYTEPQKRRDHIPRKANLQSTINKEELQAEMDEFKKRLEKTYSHHKVVDYIMEQLAQQGILRARDLQLGTDDDFIKLILACIKNDEEDIPFKIDFKDDYLFINGYRIPNLLIARKEEIS
ncbi:Wadjet anti-phage system protein JetA family protein [Desulfitibacter alkalitolerans]|uniref:Wadjet anti-phage system protein JetA family protein n=1 Tax=Desulfitibacter alkalitolerans TaxID=264641 RepID=UPI00048523ED|nr:Wadjet anti-phage system protein JetA family protein [Desulfitibacter alkalitolerans]